ncbi:MAG: two-component system, cell cycle response regulator DivK [Thermoplasmata archaeon]|jgi:CheY-like chemotaxis protein|nr:two-component system, cell cycle response regulator DivK [Thermoplasmata archaeon]
MDDLRVLVVEDSPVHQRLLQQAFHAVLPTTHLDVRPDAESAWQAVEAMRFQARALWPDFAIVDVGLPGASGIDLVDRIRRIPLLDDWPLVVLTASSDPDDEAEARLADATLFLQKPARGGWDRLVVGMLAQLGLHVAPRKAPAPRLRNPSQRE